MKWIISFGETKWAQGKGITDRAILFCTQDTIEGVSGLGSIAELLRGEVLSVIRCMGATR
jgi:hypothetical protein